MASPLLLPITATFAAPLSLINALLVFRCGQIRVTTGTYLGNTSTSPPTTNGHAHPDAKLSNGHHPESKPLNPNPTETTTYNMTYRDAPASAFDPMLLAVRNHGNFHEYVPFALVLSACVELCGGNATALKGMLAWLVAARMAHAAGLNSNVRWARAFGGVSSAVVQLGLGVWAGVLGWKAM